MSTPPLDPITIGIAVASLVVGAGAAQYLGPYLVIGLGALLGSMIALRSAVDVPNGWRAMIFALVMIALSMSIAIPFAEGMAAVVGKDWKWLAFPVATGLAAMGERGWGALWEKVKKLWFTALDNMRPS